MKKRNKYWIERNENDGIEDTCDICLGYDTQDVPLVYCDGCNIAVH
jgi:hypothetical protein